MLPFYVFGNYSKLRLMVLACVCACFALYSCQDEIDVVTDIVRDRVVDLPEEITFSQPSLYPEGIEYDVIQNRFLVSSVTQGTIGQVDDAGNYTPFIEDDDFLSTVGIEIDVIRQRLLVAVSDLGATANSTPSTTNLFAALGIYELSTGDRIAFVDLAAIANDGLPHFANDVAVDFEGNAYITDSFSPIIYKVTPSGEGSIFFQDSTFLPPPGGFGLNGIAFHPLGFLVAGFTATNTLYRIPINRPSAFSEISLDADLEGPDGLLIGVDPRELIVVNNAGGQGLARISRFRGDDLSFNSASLTGTFETGNVFPTTATQRAGETYILYAFLGDLFGGTPDRQEFTIQQANF